jgi:hypothetical protein
MSLSRREAAGHDAYLILLSWRVSGIDVRKVTDEDAEFLQLTRNLESYLVPLTPLARLPSHGSTRYSSVEWIGVLIRRKLRSVLTLIRNVMLCMACTRFRRHRVRCFYGTGGESWKDEGLHASSSLRLCG